MSCKHYDVTDRESIRVGPNLQFSWQIACTPATRQVPRSYIRMIRIAVRLSAKSRWEGLRTIFALFCLHVNMGKYVEAECRMQKSEFRRQKAEFSTPRASPSTPQELSEKSLRTSRGGGRIQKSEWLKLAGEFGGVKAGIVQCGSGLGCSADGEGWDETKLVRRETEDGR